MAVKNKTTGSALTLGPVLFNWDADHWRDFYFHIAEEAPVETVYLGETICSKRAPFLEPLYEEVADRLTAAGKTVVFSTLAQVMLRHDRQVVESICGLQDRMIEANDASALWHLSGRAHHIGPFLNVYNEDTLGVLAARGAKNICLPCELPATAIAAMGQAAAAADVSLEFQVFGRIPLALSARCYHARAHGRTRDSCQYICADDADGLELKTLDQEPFLSINGIQTLSHEYLNLIADLVDLEQDGIRRFRLSPHSCDMVEVATIFRDVLDAKLDPAEANSRLAPMAGAAGFSNGFLHGLPGYSQTGDGRATR